jgi:tRNA U54 and U55 pseudouridine synthase Pus10
VFLSRGQSPAAVILLSLAVFAAAGVGIAALRTVMPLTSKATPDTTQMLGGRTRAALEREKSLVLRSIKELEFDRAMGKVSEKDFAEMSGRLRARAARLLRQLDAGAGYREQIEREIERRLGKAPVIGGSKEQDPPYAVCVQCSTKNDADARFCKGCGKAMEPRA